MFTDGALHRRGFGLRTSQVAIGCFSEKGTSVGDCSHLDPLALGPEVLHGKLGAVDRVEAVFTATERGWL